MNKPKASTLTIILVVFVALVIIRFPFQNLKGVIFSQIYKTNGIYIIADEIYPSLLGWPGLGMENVSIAIPVGQGELDLECAKLTFRVGIGSLFPPAPSISMYMKGLKEGGNLYIRFVKIKDRLELQIDTNQLNLKQLSPDRNNSLTSGTANIDIDLTVDSSNPNTAVGTASIDLKDFALSSQNVQGVILAPMALGKINMRAVAKSGVASIETFQIGGAESDIQGTLSGDLRLEPEWDSSMLSFNLRLKAAERYANNPDAATIISFLNTFKTGEGQYSLQLNASVAQFKQSSILLLKKGG